MNRSASLVLLLSLIVLVNIIPFSAFGESDFPTRQDRRGRLMSQRAEQRRGEQQQPMLGVDVKSVRGVQVVTVLKDSPAEKAGILPGDIIMEVNKVPVNSPEELKSLVLANNSGRPLVLLVSRKESTMFLSARLQGTTTNRPSIGRGASVATAADDIDPAQTSEDPNFGYTKENPVKLGSDSPRQGAAASSVYLRQLRDKNRKPFKYSRIGNVGEGVDQHIVDLYKLTDSEGSEFKIYIDMYHPENDPLVCKAPKGMFIAQ